MHPSIGTYFLRYKGTYIHINHLLLNAFYLFRYYLGCNTMDSEIMNSNAQRGRPRLGLVDCAGHRGLSALPSRCYFGLSRALRTYLLQSLQIVACAYQVPRHRDRQHKKSVTGIVHTSRIVLPRAITKKDMLHVSRSCQLRTFTFRTRLLSLVSTGTVS